MSRGQALFLRKGLLGTGVFVALLMLASFYSIVNGAVDRAARHRLAAADGSARTTAIAARPGARNADLLARVEN